jgi:hypothetical protein
MTVVMAHAAAQENDFRRAANYLGLTILFGFGFLGVKGVEYTTEIVHGFTPASGIFWSFYFGMTGLHGLHVLAGIIVNVVLWIGALRAPGAKGHQRQLAGLYWHFDIVWIFLFPCCISREEGKMSNSHSRHYLIIWLAPRPRPGFGGGSLDPPKTQALVLIFAVAIARKLCWWRATIAPQE